MKVYVASSWKNEEGQQAVVKALRAAGHEVYDFRNPAPGVDGFSWSTVDPDWRTWTPAEYVQALAHPVAVEGFRRDMKALLECDACVLVQPCGSSAHLELGHAVGAGKYTVALCAPGREAELMLNMVDKLALSVGEVLAAINRWERARGERRFAYCEVSTTAGPEWTRCAAKYRGLAVTQDLYAPSRWHVTHEATGYSVSTVTGQKGLPKEIALALMFELGPMADWAAMGEREGSRLWKDSARIEPMLKARAAAYARAAAQEGGGQ